MRVLILTCNTGQGHNSAANALKELFDSADIYCEICDSLAFLSPKASKFISNWHTRLYKNAPVLFGLGYKKAEHTASRHKKSMLYEVVGKGAKKLRQKVTDDDIDTVICTHPFSAMTLTRAMKKYGVKLDKTYFVSTDYTCSPGVGTSNLDYYIIPHDSLKKDFTNFNIPEEKLFPGGIPVSKKVHTLLSKEDIYRQLSIPLNKRVIVLMCGSMGCGPIKFIARRICAFLKDDEYLVVICGSNRRLYQKLRQLEDPGSVRILGYTRNVMLYLHCADLLLTKPGGLSTTEAAEKNLPMVLIDAVSGCETHNMNFWINNGMAKSCDNTEGLCCLVRHLMDNTSELEEIRHNLKENFSYSSSEKIFNFIMQNSKNKE